MAAVTEDAAVSDLRQMLNADNDYTFTAYLLPQTIGAEGLQIEAAMTTADGRRIYYFLEIPVSDWPEMKAGYSYNYTLTANDYMTASPTVLEISGTDINPWTEVNKEETPDAKALGTEAYVNGAEWGEMENEEIVPEVK